MIARLSSVFLVALLVRADFKPSDWRYRKAVYAPAGERCVVRIDRQVYLAAQSGLADLRLLDGREEVPYVVGPAPEIETVADAVPARREEASATVLTLDLGGAGIPYHRAVLEAGPGEFQRSVWVETSADAKDWSTLSTDGRISRVGGREHLSVSFPEQQQRYVRLRVQNGDDKPLAFSRIRLEGWQRQLLFEARATGWYWLYYGNPSARPPVYDLAAVLARKGPRPETEILAGAQQPNPDYRPPSVHKPWTENPAALYGTLVLAVLGLGGLVVRFLAGLKAPPHRVYLSLGSNLGDRAALLRQAIEELNKAGVSILRVSSLYETEPRDLPDQPWFLNQVAEASSALPPLELLAQTQRIEHHLGRLREIPKGPRTIDIDILLYGPLTLQTPQLEIPHPRMTERRFVLEPLLELSPDLLHPATRQPFSELLPSVQSQPLRKL